MAEGGEGGRGPEARERREALEVYVLPSLRSIEKEASARTAEGRRLREAASEAVRSIEHDRFGTLPLTGSRAHSILAPILLACRSGRASLTDPGLEALHKLIANAYLAENTDVGPVAEAATSAADIRKPSVQLSVIRALVSLATSQEVALKRSPLIAAIRCLCNLAIGGCSEHIAAAARGATFQVVDFTVTRYLRSLRAHHRRSSRSVTPVTDDAASPTDNQQSSDSSLPSSSDRINSSTTTVRHVSLPDAKSLATLAESSQVEELEAALGEKDDGNGEIEGADEDDVQSDIKNAESALPDGAERKQHSERERGESIGDERNTSMNSSNKHTHGDVPEEDGSSSPSSLDTESEAVKAQKARQAQASEVEREMKQPSVEIKSIKREGAKRKSRRADDNDLGERELVASGLPREEIDAKLVLRALCRMALSDPDAGDDSFSSKARALALDLLRQLFFNTQGAELLVEASETLRRPLAKALVRNGSSTNTGSFFLSTQILLALLLHARHLFKVEIGVLYPLLVLKPIEHMASGTLSASHSESPPNVTQSSLVSTSSVQTGATLAQSSLRVVKSFWASPQALADVFANYDCDVASPDVYSRTVYAVSRLLHTGTTSKTRTTALECVLVLVDSLEHWSRAGASGCIANGVSTTSSRKSLDEQQTVDTSTSRPDWHSLNKQANHDERGDTDEAERYTAAKSRKRKMESAAAEFNADPVHAMAAMIERGEVGPLADDQARFLTQTHGLDKGKLGDFLGHHGENQVAVMQRYMRQFDFSCLELDEALRFFLASFRLPGEAQKIDRIVEAFASRYAECNEESEFGAEAGYIVSFAIVMLNTDAHNPAMEGGKMSKEDFVQMASSSESSSNVSHQKLESIYDRIVQQELDVPASNDSKATRNGTTRAVSAAVDFAMPWKRRHGREIRARREAEQLLERTRSAFNSAQGKSVFQSASSPALARLMLESAGEEVLAMCSTSFESATSAEEASRPLQGARKALRLAATLRLGTLRAHIVSFLAQAPSLDAPRAVSARHGEALRVLLELASSAESYPLGEAWSAVLTALSQLQQLRLVGTNESDATPFIPKREPQTPAVAELKGIEDRRQQKENDLGDASAHATNTINAQHQQQYTLHHYQHQHHPFLDRLAPALTELHHNQMGHLGDMRIPQDVLQHMGEWLRESGDDVVDRVFAGTVNLDSEEIVHFTKALAAVSQAELWPSSGSQPQLFSLSRLVEMAHANIGRVRLVWSSIWAVISTHLVRASAHWQSHVAVCAVDSLRQVSSAVLRRSISTGGAYEADAFKPFETIVQVAPIASARELAVESVSNMLEAFGKDVGSGHKSALLVLKTCANDPASSVASAALSASERVALLMADRISDDCLADAINAVAAFATSGAHSKLQSKAISVLRETGNSLAHCDRISVRKSSRDANETQKGESAIELAWVPLLTALADASFGEGPLADEALDALFSCLLDHEDELTDSVWRRASEMALLPLMDPARAELEVEDQQTWLAVRARSILPRLYNLIASSARAAELLAQDLCACAAQAACADHKELCTEGLRALAQVGKRLCLRSEEQWLYWVRCIQQAMHVHASAKRWALHLGCVSALGECVGGNVRALPARARREACETLARVRTECTQRNQSIAEESMAFGRTQEHPQLHARAEVAAGTALLACLETVVRDADAEHYTSDDAYAVRTLGAECEAVVTEAAEFEELGRWRGRSLRAMRAPLVASAVTTFGAIPDKEYMPRLRRAYTALARLVCTDQPQVCRAVSWLFSNRLAPLIQAAFESSSGGVGSEESCDSAR